MRSLSLPTFQLRASLIRYESIPIDYKIHIYTHTRASNYELQTHTSPLTASFELLAIHSKDSTLTTIPRMYQNCSIESGPLFENFKSHALSYLFLPHRNFESHAPSNMIYLNKPREPYSFEFGLHQQILRALLY